MAPLDRVHSLESFAPSIDEGCRVLVLGSAPSIKSLERCQYYGHPQNYFWRFVEELFGIPFEDPYEDRLLAVRRRGLAIWDVVGRCTREMSADSTIRDVEPNDFARLFARYPLLRAVFFNGAKSEELFERLVRPGLDETQLCFERLPSTSPANASQKRDDKLARWRRVLDFLDDGAD